MTRGNPTCWTSLHEIFRFWKEKTKEENFIAYLVNIYNINFEKNPISIMRMKAHLQCRLIEIFKNYILMQS